MKKKLAVVCFLTCLTIHAFSQSAQDSVQVDKKKMEEVIKTIKEHPEFKNPDMKDVTFSYPDKVSPTTKWIDVVVKRRGEEIIYYGVDPRTYELTGEIIDLR